MRSDKYEAYLCSDLGDGLRRRIDSRLRAWGARRHDHRVWPRVRRSYDSVDIAAAAGAGGELDSGPARVTLSRANDQRAGIAQPVWRRHALNGDAMNSRTRLG